MKFWTSWDDHILNADVIASLTVLAPGLLGSSVAKAVRSRGLAKTIHVWARRAETRAGLRKLDWCDEVHDSPALASAHSDLVVVCTPVDRIVPIVEEIAPALRPGAIVTDVGSVKSAIVRPAAAALRNRAHFVGSHPMAGSDRTGHAHASADLFRGRPCFVTPLLETAPDALETVVNFWKALDAVVVTEKPEKHDEIVAHISHLPHAVASVLCATLAARDRAWLHLAGPGLRDSTRIAASDADLWRSILEMNREEVLRCVRAFQDELEVFQAALANNDVFAIRSILERGREYRSGLPS